MRLGEKQHVRVVGSFLSFACPFVFPTAMTTVPSSFSSPLANTFQPSPKDPHALDTLTFGLIKGRLGRLKLLLNRAVWEAAGSFQNSI